MPPPPSQIDGEMLIKDTVQALRENRFSKVDLLLGVTGDEGYVLLNAVIPELASQKPDLEKVEEQLKGYFTMINPNNAEVILEEVTQHYFGGHVSNETTDKLRQTVAKIIGHHILTAPTYLLAQYHSGIAVSVCHIVCMS